MQLSNRQKRFIAAAYIYRTYADHDEFDYKGVAEKMGISEREAEITTRSLCGEVEDGSIFYAMSFGNTTAIISAYGLQLALELIDGPHAEGLTGGTDGIE